MSMIHRSPLAVVGVSALFPGSVDAGGFWRDIRAGKDLLTEVPATHWLPEDHYDPDPSAPDKTYAKRGGFLSPVAFDAAHWGLPPKILQATDTSQLLAMMVAEQVLRDAARGQFETMDRSRISVILGVTSAQELLVTMASRLQKPIWVKSLREHGVPEEEVQDICQRISDHYPPWEENTFPGLLGNVVAGRIANRLNLGGSNFVTDAACASSMAALSMAAQELHLGESDLVITGGVDTLNDIFMFTCFSKTPALSPTGDCRPFSDAGDGTMLGEGLGMVALKRMEDAERDGDHIYALLRGLGASSDGRAKSVYAPVAEGQASALRRAQAMAGFDPRTIELMEAHGTGTKAGDLAEFEGLKLAFPAGDTDEDRQWCALGSVKSQIGHTKAAAGAAGLFKVVMALHHKILPPTIKVSSPNPGLGLGLSAFHLNLVGRPWIRGARHPRRAGVSSFGFGGSNFHALLEEYAGPAPRPALVRAMPAELIVLGGRDGLDVAAQARALAARAAEPGLLAWAAWHTQTHFKPGSGARLALVAEATAPWGERLEQAAVLIVQHPETPFEWPDGTAYGTGPAPTGVALLFPGQGSQYLAMGAELAMAFPMARRVWDRASDLVPGLSKVVFPPVRFEAGELEADEGKLQQTRWAQPAIGCASAAMLALVRALGLAPSALAGHSFGEATALHAAGVLAEPEFLGLARCRGELMAAAAAQGAPGAMSAVAASEQQVRGILAAIGSPVVLANLNAPSQTVLSGGAEALALAEAALEREGIQVRRLPVAAAFHSPLVAASAGPFAAFLEGLAFAPASTPVYSGASAAPYEADPAGLQARLGRQILEPVRFCEMIRAMADTGIHTFIEVGPGSVLSGLVGQILADRPHAAVPLDRRGGSGVTALLKGLARLTALGLPLAFTALWEGYGEPEDPAGRVPPKLPVMICGINLGKHYPPSGGAAALPPPNPPRAAMPLLPPQPESLLREVLPESVHTEVPPRRPTEAMEHGDEPVAPGPAWLDAWRESQSQTAQTHARVQQSMAEAHSAYLRASEVSLRLLAELAAGTAVPAPPALQGALPEPRPLPRAGEPESSPVPPVQPVLALVPAVMPVKDAKPAELVAGPTPASPRQPGLDLQALMLSVVAEKTGYPEAMLNLSMDMESELGIDSIKRVEILAAMQDRAPGLPPVDAGRMSSLRTLAQIVAYMGGLAAPKPAPALDLQALMLSVVAEKTGYPEAMLNLSMDMESELGIDSIKRVEILAAMQDRAPGLPPVDAGRMSSLRTLAQIVAYMGGLAAPERPQAVAAPAPAVPDGVAQPALRRFRLERVAAPALGFGLAGLRQASDLVVSSDGGPIAAALVAELQARGLQARCVETVPATADAVLFLGGLREPATEAEALAINHEAFCAARAVASRFSQGHGLLVTVQDTGGDFGLGGTAPLRALLAGLPALVKTAKQEWPEASLAAIDLERAGRDPETLARILADELLLGGGELEVGLAAAGGRSTLRSVEAPVPAGPEVPLLRPDDVVVVSGGARGVTAACVVAWARRTGARFALLGRSGMEEPACCLGVIDGAGLKRVLLAQADSAGLPLSPLELARQADAVLAAREVRATLEAIAKAGGQARYLQADVQDPAAVAGALTQVRAEWGPINALVHGAGVLADKRIADLDDASFHRVLATKVTGLQVLLAATASDPLKALALFSSVAARCGNHGQAAYAMANEVLNKLAQVEARRRGQATLVKALGWGPWEGGMVNPQLRAHFAELGVPMLPLETGGRIFADEMAGGDRVQVEVILGGEPRPEKLLAVGSQVRSLELEVHVDGHSHGYLVDHSIRGAVVVPLVLVTEWFVRAARAFRPGWGLQELKDLRVRRGVKLERFPMGQTLTLRCTQRTGADLDLALLGADGNAYYQARARLDGVLPVLEPGPELAGLEPWGQRRIYGDVLFHGPLFHGVERIEGVGKAGIEGLFRSVLGASWPPENWQIDLFALDGTAQLAGLWARENGGAAFVPMGFASLQVASGPMDPSPVRVRVRCRRPQATKVLADAWVLDAAGRTLMDLRGLELVQVPNTEGVR